MSDVLAATDPLGLHTYYYRIDGGGVGDSVHSLLKKPPLAPLALDREGVLECLREERSGRYTCFEAVRPIPTGCGLVACEDGYDLRPIPRPAGTGQSAEVAMECAVRKILDDPRPKAVALSGGLDSALVLSLVRRAGGPRVPVYTLASGMPGYCEFQHTQQTADVLGVDRLRVVHVTRQDFTQALLATVAAAEVPLYNLHPVSKLLLARALRADGFELVITGDAADQVFGTSDGRDYLPVVGSLFRAEGVELATPFADQDVIAAAESAGRDASKSVLRRLAGRWVPAICLDRPKRPTYAPAMDLSSYERPALAARLAEDLGLPVPLPVNDRQRTLWITLGLLVERFREEHESR